ncbi:MAG: serine/threonine protein kinase [Thermomonas sp.]|uniref:serine/threonine-protein kinase n=1 Tax=Thermomonas sp. TaxID=1971895 RepID=UPI002637FDAF|nr:serine/threonine-protein kinase [Thermomonas sp.]MCC7096948.1 serine/threonine protein kinase [Thermomonas sp.]
MDSERWLRLSPLLDALLELDPDARSEHLRTLSEQDPTLAAELEHLLQLDAETPDFLGTPALSMSCGPIPGSRIGPYRLERLLGEGGMGQVWLAERADGLYERKVALKLLRPGLADPRLHQRFIREREILARFEHPNIARLLDAGSATDGQPYLALEYVEGEPLASYCQTRQLDIPARLALFRDVCTAVSHAHANLIVHRDLKPSNILVTPAGHVRLLDFGIAKLLDAEPVPVEQTRTGVRTFTLHYAAPEQIRGEPVTTMTDVYSLGVVLYELLTGSKPYRLKRETDAEWEEAIIEGEPMRPSLAAARAAVEQVRPYTPARLAKLLSGDLDNIVLKALAKAPSQRYSSAEALSQDLLSYQNGRPVIARGESVSYRMRKYIYRHRWGLATTAAILVVLVSALGLVSWQAQRALREANRAQAMQHFVTELFEDAGSSANTPIDVRSLLDMGILRGERSLARQPQARAELYGVVARLRLGLGDYREAGDLLERQSRLLAQLPDAPDGLRLEAATLRGNVHQQLGESAQCTLQMQPLEPSARRNELQLALVVAGFYSQLGRCHRDQGEADAARRLFTSALELRRKEDDVGGVAEARLDLAILQSDAGRPEEAIRTLKLALDQLRQRAGDHHPMAIDMRRALCMLERATDALDDALRDCRASLALAQELHGRSHRTTIDASRQLAALYVDLGRFNEAEVIFLDTTAWMRTRLDPNHPDMARAYNSLAIVAWERGDIERALRFQRQAVAAWRKSGNPVAIANGLYNLAMILHDARHEREALEPVLESIQLRARQFGVDNGLVGDGERLRGEILAALGERTAARAALEQAVRITSRDYRTGHSHTRRAEISLERLRAQDGDSAAIAQLVTQSQRNQGDIEQHKASWLAGAYAAEAQCRDDDAVLATAQLDALLIQVHSALPEGGAVPRQIKQIRDTCARSAATPKPVAARQDPARSARPAQR